ncbi:MAG: adenylate/guanylate cyclase domain-containing protein [Flammeovirgaceae bacterium]
MQEGKDGEVWLSGLLTSTSPALRFKKNRDGTYVKDDAPFMLVPPQMVLGFYVEKNGNAWLGGGDGLYKYSPTKTTTKRQGKFYTLIREVRTTNDSLVFGGNYFQESDNERYLALQQPKELKPALSSDQNLLLFRFAAAYYEYTEETEYQYKLEGFDSQWSAWTKRTEKEYSNLFGGNFTFRVRAKNVHGVIGEEASYSFKLAWPWYARWWAISLYVIGLVGILWGCIRWYSNQLKRDNARLEGIVNMRTAEIVEKNEELSQQNEEINRQNTQLEGTYRNVKMLSELGQEITSHLSVEKIIDTVYASVNDLMDAAGFGIGIYNEDSNELDFPGFIEKGEKLPYHSEPLDQEGLGAWCFTHRKEILMGNVEEEYQHYFDKEFETVAGNLTRSLIYLPLLAKNKAIGIITVQSFKKHAFSKYHLNMMRNLAVYVAIALENAESFHKIAEQKEEIAEQRDQLEQEKEKSDQLLLNILPQSTAEELKATGSAKPQLYESVTILFTDLINFTQLAEKLPAEELVAELDKIFRKFDEIVTKYNLEKIKTIGDAYMCVGGIPATNTVHPMNTVKAGLEMQTFITQQAMTKSGIPCQLRVGIHTGRVVAGVVGKKKFAYDIWGDAVNLAARMESNGEAGKVNISGATYELVKEEFSCDYRGKVEVKHKGEVDMYFVNAIKADGKQ